MSLAHAFYGGNMIFDTHAHYDDEQFNEDREELLKELAPRFQEIDHIAEYNQAKVVYGMQKNRVSSACFVPTTGYGHNDVGSVTLS